MSEQKLLIDFARKAWTSNVLREHSSVQRFVKMTQISVSTVCCFSFHDGNLHILQNVMKSDQMELQFIAKSPSLP